MGSDTRIAVLVTIILAGAVAVSSYLRTPYGAYIAIAFTVVVLIMVFTGRIRGDCIPIYLFGASLCLMWQASMYGAHIIGSDMHGEYYVSSTILSEGHWDIARHYGSQSSTSVLVSGIIPLFASEAPYMLLWMYKAVLPFMFSFTPVVLYYTYKQFMNDRYAFYSALFWMIVPITTLEIVQIGKSMGAELFMAMAIYALVSKELTLRNRAIMLLVFSGTSMLFHYTVGIALVAFMFGILLVRLILSNIPWLKILAIKATPIYLIAITLGAITAGGYAYYNYADEGVIVKVMAKVAPAYSKLITDTTVDVAQDIYLVNSTNPNDPTAVDGIVEQQEVLVKTSIGMDFFDVSASGKAFRLIQYLTQFLILAGGALLLFIYKRYKFTAEFIAGIWCGYLLLAMCVFVPQFSSIINVTRFYHFALFFLAPMFVIGSIVVLRKEAVLVLVMIVYFIFTSGLVYEITGSNVIHSVDTPYAIGLSADRTGVVATYTRDDVKAGEWLRDNANPDYMIVGDYNGWHLVSAYLGLDRLREDKAVYNPTFDNLPGKSCYIFVTTWNTEHGLYIDSLWAVMGGAGLRERYALPEFDYPIVFRSGNAVIYLKE